MKNLLTSLAMAMMAVSANAQAVIAEVDWTQESDYYNDVQYTSATITASVTHEGLVVQSTPSESANIWEAQIPIIAHIKELKEGGRYQVKFTVNSTIAGELHVDLMSWDGLTYPSETIDLKEGLNEITTDFLDYPIGCTDAMVRYQCGNLPGTHIIKKVQLIDLDGEQDGDIIYNLDKNNKTAEVKGVAKNFKGKIVIPETVVYDGEEYTVTKIGDKAFYALSELVSVTIPNSVTSIGYDAFYNCVSLISVDIPGSVTTIGHDAFGYCSSLVSLTIPNGVTHIGSYAFANCRSLVTLTIPSSVTRIEDHAFAGCTSLNSVNFQSSLTRIGEFVFFGCNITEIKIAISDYTSFNKNAILSQFVKEDLFSPVTLTDTEGNEIKEFVIPSDVTSIGNGAFYNCSGLTSITIPDGVTSIGESAFRKCSGLVTVTIPNSVTSIGEGAFSECRGLVSISLPDDIAVIRKQTFYCCGALENITIPASVEYIYQEAFVGCERLRRVYVMPENPPFAFDNSFSNYYINLYVLEASKDKYMNTAPWSKFAFVKIWTGNIDEPEIRCATPTISYKNGKLTFECETEGAVCESIITNEDIKSYVGNEVQLAVTYHISVYATRPDCDNSETVTATLCWIDADPMMGEQDATTVASVRANPVLIQSFGNKLILSEVADGTFINVYDTTGRMVGSAKATTGTTTIETSLHSGEICIVKIGEKAVKVLMK